MGDPPALPVRQHQFDEYESMPFARCPDSNQEHKRREILNIEF
jgi:hypothetical protein